VARVPGGGENAGMDDKTRRREAKKDAKKRQLSLFGE
jgi:hypothetical protein